MKVCKRTCQCFDFSLFVSLSILFRSTYNLGIRSSRVGGVRLSRIMSSLSSRDLTESNSSTLHLKEAEKIFREIALNRSSTNSGNSSSSSSAQSVEHNLFLLQTFVEFCFFLLKIDLGSDLFFPPYFFFFFRYLSFSRSQRKNIQID